MLAGRVASEMSTAEINRSTNDSVGGQANLRTYHYPGGSLADEPWPSLIYAYSHDTRDRQLPLTSMINNIQV